MIVPSFWITPLLPGPILKNNIAEYKTTEADTSDFDSEALVDGDVLTHGDNCNTASTSGGEVVTWTLNLQHEYYLHTVRIYNTGCGEWEGTVKPKENFLIGFKLC